MSNKNRERSTLLKGTNNVPKKDRDQYFPEDFIKDMNYHDGKRGDFWENFLDSVPSIRADMGVISLITLAGGGINNTSIAISEIQGWVKDSDNITRPVFLPASTQTPDITHGNGNYFVKIGYIAKETSFERRKVYDAVDYKPFTQDDVSIVINKTAPTEDELCLGAFAVVSGKITSIVTNTTFSKRSKNAKFNYSNFPPPNNSIQKKHLELGLQGAVDSSILTKYRGANAVIYPNKHDISFRQGSVFENQTIQTVTVSGENNSLDDMEQLHPVCRVDNKQENIDSSKGYSVPTVSSGGTSHEFVFTISTDLLFSNKHQRLGFNVKTKGSGYTGLVIELREKDVADALATVTVALNDINEINTLGANQHDGWNYADLIHELSPSVEYHYRFYTAGFSGGVSPVLSMDSGDNLTFREMYKPLGGKFGSANQQDLINIVDSSGNNLVEARSSNADVGFAGEEGLDYMAVDLSTQAKWDAFNYRQYIGVDLISGRVKLPEGYDVRDYFVEFNIKESLDGIDAKNILRHGAKISVEDSLARTDNFENFVANEAISAGDIVRLRHDGKIEKGVTCLSIGTKTRFQNDTARYVNIEKLNDTTIVGGALCDNLRTTSATDKVGYLTRIGTLDEDGVITWGTGDNTLNAGFTSVAGKFRCHMVRMTDTSYVQFMNSNDTTFVYRMMNVDVANKTQSDVLGETNFGNLYPYNVDSDWETNVLRIDDDRFLMVGYPNDTTHQIKMAAVKKTVNSSNGTVTIEKGSDLFVPCHRSAFTSFRIANIGNIFFYFYDVFSSDAAAAGAKTNTVRVIDTTVTNYKNFATEKKSMIEGYFYFTPTLLGSSAAVFSFETGGGSGVKRLALNTYAEPTRNLDRTYVDAGIDFSMFNFESLIDDTQTATWNPGRFVHSIDLPRKFGGGFFGRGLYRSNSTQYGRSKCVVKLNGGTILYFRASQTFVAVTKRNGNYRVSRAMGIVNLGNLGRGYFLCIQLSENKLVAIFENVYRTATSNATEVSSAVIHTYPMIGVASEDIASGSRGKIVPNGIIEVPGKTFDRGRVYYANSDGSIRKGNKEDFASSTHLVGRGMGGNKLMLISDDWDILL